MLNKKELLQLDFIDCLVKFLIEDFVFPLLPEIDYFELVLPYILKITKVFKDVFTEEIYSNYIVEIITYLVNVKIVNIILGYTRVINVINGIKILGSGFFYKGKLKDNKMNKFGKLIVMKDNNQLFEFKGHFTNNYIKDYGCCMFDNIIISCNWKDGEICGNKILIALKDINTSFIITNYKGKLEVKKTGFQMIDYIPKNKYIKNKEKYKTGFEGEIICKVCFNKKCDILFYPCGHICSCIDCSKKNKTEMCYICKSSIEKVIKVYY